MRSFLFVAAILCSALSACSGDTNTTGGQGGAGAQGGAGGDGGTGGSQGGTGGSAGGGAGGAQGGTGGAQGGAGGAQGGAGGASGGAAGAGGSFDPAQDPLVVINHPGDGECRVVGMAFPVIGVATDPQDGNIAASLAWNDSLEGNIGSGGMFMFAPQVVGTHTITASLVDSDGNPGSDQITIMVQQACP